MIYFSFMSKIRKAYKLSDRVIELLFQKLEQKGISNYRVSKECLISEAALSYLKKFKTKPKLFTLMLIADEFEIDLAEIIQEVMGTQK